MREYAIDFTMHRGHEMVLSDPAWLTRDRLEELELRMLQAEKVPGLLEVEWLELDGAVSFHYKLEGKRMLAHRLQLQPMSMADYCSLLLAVLETLESCRLYMLRPEAILLHENYMFAGDSWQELGLVYVPVQESASLGQPPAQEALLGLAVRWATHIQCVDGTALQQILQRLDPGSGSLTELRQLLLDMVSAPYGTMAEAHPRRIEASARAMGTSYATKDESSVAAAQLDAADEEERGKLPSYSYVADEKLKPTGGRAAGPSSRRASYEDEVDASASEAKESKGGVRLPVMLLLAVCLVIAVIWRFVYLEAPGKANLLISSGLSLLVTGSAALLYLGLRKREHEHRNEHEHEAWLADEGEESDAAAEIPTRDRGAGATAANKQPLSTERSAARWSMQLHEAKESFARVAEHAPVNGHSQISGYQSETVKTVGAFAGQEEATMLLGGGHKGTTADTAESDTCYLQRTYSSEAKVVELAQSRLIIGRSADHAGYVDEGRGVSRAHIELVKKEGTVIAKDLGSRNGTLYNGQLMVPYKQYPLKGGDRLQLAGMDGPLYELQSQGELDVRVSG